MEDLTEVHTKLCDYVITN
jgi:hypothetical protein